MRFFEYSHPTNSYSIYLSNLSTIFPTLNYSTSFSTHFSSEHSLFRNSILGTNEAFYCLINCFVKFTFILVFSFYWLPLSTCLVAKTVYQDVFFLSFVFCEVSLEHPHPSPSRQSVWFFFILNFPSFLEYFKVRNICIEMTLFKTLQ